MSLAENEIACPTITNPVHGQASALAHGWTFLTRLRVLMRPSLRAAEDISRRYESCRWCDSTERQLNNEIMFGRSWF
jgi:hypothetical protein